MTTGMLVAAKMKPIKAGLYIIFQCLGGVAGAAVLKVCVNFVREECGKGSN